MKKYVVTKFNRYLDLWQFNENYNDHINILSTDYIRDTVSATYLWVSPFSEWVQYQRIQKDILGEYNTIEELIINYPEFWM